MGDTIDGEIAQLEPVAAVYEATDSTTERMRVLCQLAESLDEAKLRRLSSDADDAFAYPSLSGMSRDEARMVMDRIAAVRDFREALDDV